MQTVTLSENTLRRLHHAASQRGQDADALAVELLEVSLAVLEMKGDDALSARKPYRAMEFRGIAPTGRTAAEIDSHIEASREEWNCGVA